MFVCHFNIFWYGGFIRHCTLLSFIQVLIILEIVMTDTNTQRSNVSEACQVLTVDKPYKIHRLVIVILFLPGLKKLGQFTSNYHYLYII